MKKILCFIGKLLLSGAIIFGMFAVYVYITSEKCYYALRKSAK